MCDDIFFLINIYIGWFGSIYDVRVLWNFELFIRVEVGSCIDFDKFIIGDSVYLLKLWFVILFRVMVD